jgi:hypothetical protein
MTTLDSTSCSCHLDNFKLKYINLIIKLRGMKMCFKNFKNFILQTSAITLIEAITSVTCVLIFDV